MNISNRIAHSRPLATTAMHGRAEALRNAGEQVIDLSIAISHFPAPAAVLDAVSAALGKQRTMPYTEVGGALRVREALRAKLGSENGIAASVDEIIVTNGCKQAYYQALYAMTDPGDRIAVFRPYWPAYLATAELLGLEVVMTDLPDTLTPATLAAFGKVKALVLNNPHNPSGKVFTRAELEHILDWAAAGGVHLIVDESYEHLIFDGEHVSLASLCQDERAWRDIGIVTMFSASQSYAMMGWRVGFALAPQHIVKAMQNVQGPITAAAPHLSQVAAAAAFATGAPHEMMRDYRLRRDLVLHHLAEVPWIGMQAPASGPYLWGDVRALTMDTVGFAERLIEQQRVALMPGDALGVPGFIRIGYISDDHATLMEGVRRIVDFGERLRTGTP
ncbi:pyridoxal phosphate-dependent aminotransferase [Massilia sp. YIM B02443]|uniref:pyridoxal phosphate-dependent aminotransferase n=1 Tax=Massilia sp. YIM B02443 TaxID=3050127 RepID=UPI0025B6FE94|nr:aminotransferase class I/II-fold pyridoxal phosphate-dependent enzyme [Massilia sp. YIM B02443]MDN4039592.1 aminotransferase class I/II-fold pyridoxal phosphate-dependent enzyme [Massilia sp. YIM B02443]